MTEICSIQVGGFNLKGLASLTFRRGIYALSAGFSLDVMLEDANSIQAGDRISAKIYGVEFAGFIDRIVMTCTGTTRTHKLEARSHADLVDTSIEKVLHCERENAKTILEKLTLLKVKSNHIPKVPIFLAQGGENKLAAIQRLAKIAVSLIYSNGLELCLDAAKPLDVPHFVINEKVAIQTITKTTDISQCFSEYRSQLYDDVGETVQGQGRKRILAFPPTLSPDLMCKYLDWEKTSREARAEAIQLKVQLEDKPPSLLTPVLLDLPSLGMQGIYVIASQTISLTPTGHTMDLSLQSAGAIAMNPTVFDQQSAASRLWSQ